MKRYVLAGALLALCLSVPAQGQSVSGIFALAGDRVEAKQAKLSFPKALNGLALKEAYEFSRKGENLDSAAEYRSDSGIWATIYVYRPGYPDAALAAYETDRNMPLVWGKGVTRLTQSVVAFGGRPASAIRITYKGGEREKSGPLASASAFARIGGWIVKFRVSGPVALQSQVEATLDALLGAAQIDKTAVVYPVAPLDIGSCPAGPSGAVKASSSEKSGANALGAAIMAVQLDDPQKSKEEPLPPSFPANGLTKVCSRGALPNGMEVLQPAGETAPGTILVVLNDYGDAVAVTKNLLDSNYTILRSRIATMLVLGEIDRIPDNAELVRVFSGALPGVLDTRVSVIQKASGDASIQVNSALMK